jgi:hypothetical protein
VGLLLLQELQRRAEHLHGREHEHTPLGAIQRRRSDKSYCAPGDYTMNFPGIPIELPSSTSGGSDSELRAILFADKVLGLFGSSAT